MTSVGMCRDCRLESVLDGEVCHWCAALESERKANAHVEEWHPRSRDWAEFERRNRLAPWICAAWLGVTVTEQLWPYWTGLAALLVLGIVTCWYLLAPLYHPDPSPQRAADEESDQPQSVPTSGEQHRYRHYRPPVDTPVRDVARQTAEALADEVGLRVLDSLSTDLRNNLAQPHVSTAKVAADTWVQTDTATLRVSVTAEYNGVPLALAERRTKGICPYCYRSVVNVGRHVASQH